MAWTEIAPTKNPGKTVEIVAATEVAMMTRVEAAGREVVVVDIGAIHRTEESGSGWPDLCHVVGSSMGTGSPST